jgi:hypothetical protein
MTANRMREGWIQPTYTCWGDRESKQPRGWKCPRSGRLILKSQKERAAVKMGRRDVQVNCEFWGY